IFNVNFRFLDIKHFVLYHKNIMKNKKKLILTISLILVFLIVYTIVSLKPLYPELQFTPKWSFDISQTQTSPLSETELIPFNLGGKIGYFSPEGSLAYKYEVPQKSTISENYYILYGNDSASFEIRNPDSSLAGKIESSGFPFLKDERLFVFAPGGNSISEFDVKGNNLMRYEGYSPILAFNANKYGLILGFSDGEIHSIYNDGTQLSAYPGGSDYEIIYGADIARDMNLSACVCGYDDQRFVLYRRNEDRQKIIFHEYLSSQTKSRAPVCFTQDSRFVYYSNGNEVGIVDCEKLKSRHFDLKGQVLKIAEIPEMKSVFILSKNGRDNKVTVIDDNTNVIGEYNYQADSTFVSARENLLFIGADDEIACLEITLN
ncbi:MAG: hypothetical protein K5839_06935, partial [Treponemataceae bacterium]|nr:hypothetical protein [Treponemataceae bacterium]